MLERNENRSPSDGESDTSGPRSHPVAKSGKGAPYSIFEAYHTRHIPTDTAIDESRCNFSIAQFVQLESKSKYKLLDFDFPVDYERLTFACAAVDDNND